MKRISFAKLVGTGNDFIVVDNRRGVLKDHLPALAKRLSSRTESVGADGMLLLERSRKADIRMRIFNPDGSEADMCGNGIRCIAKFAADRRITGTRMKVETPAGLIVAEVKGRIVKARLSDPKDLKLGIRLEANGRTEEIQTIHTGVPHAVIVEPSLDTCDVNGRGRAIRFHKYFAPKGTNVNFISIGPGNVIRVRTYERGVEGETLSCGTGSTASALIAARLKGLRSPVRVRTASGKALKIYFSKERGKFHDVALEGEVSESFEGRVRI